MSYQRLLEVFTQIDQLIFPLEFFIFKLALGIIFVVSVVRFLRSELHF